MPRDTPVRAYMSADVLTFSPDDNVQNAMQVIIGGSVTARPWSTRPARSSGCSPRAT